MAALLGYEFAASADLSWGYKKFVQPDVFVVPHARAARIEREVLAWHPEGASEPFLRPLAELFQPL